MTKLRSLLFNAFFYLWTTLILLGGLPLMLGPRSGLYHLGRLWVRGIMAVLRLSLRPATTEIRGLEHLPQGGFLVAPKHQSAWDTLIFSVLLWEHSFVLKQELTWIPVFGLYLIRAGLVPVDRKGGSKALRKMVTQARRVIAEGRPLVIFPEGTRVAPGDRRPYHPGVAALYSQLDVPVVPVALNSGCFWGRRSFAKKPGTITLEFLPKIEPGLKRERNFCNAWKRLSKGAAAPLRRASPAGRAAIQASGSSSLCAKLWTALRAVGKSRN